MYTKLKLSDIQLGEVKVGNIEIEAKYKLEEVVGIYDLFKKAIKEMPETLEDVAKTASKFMDLEKEFEVRAREDFEEEMNRKAQTMEMIKSTMDKILTDFKAPSDGLEY